MAALLVSLLPVAPASAAAPWIGTSAPQYESPGGTVPVIVTAHQVPHGYAVAISASGVNGATAFCSGRSWHNPLRRTVSRKCYLQLPTRQGTYNVKGAATLSRPGHSSIRVSGRGGRPVLANGYRSLRPMSLATIREIERCHNKTDNVWLTFDDGAYASQLHPILATLRKNKVRGRFFFTGGWARSNPSLLHRIKADGHIVVNHTRSHAPLSKLSSADVAREIRGGVRANTQPALLGPPFAAGVFTERLRRIAAAQGHLLCRWTVDTYDWDGATARQMVERIRYGDYRTPPLLAGGNILMHGKGRYTATSLQAIIDAVRAKRLLLEPLEP